MSKKGEEAKTGMAKFPKRQFLKSVNLSRIERDVLVAILKDDKHYTLDEVQKLLKNFMARRVQ